MAIVQLLLSNGANPQLVAENIGTPKEAALANKHIDLVRLLDGKKMIYIFLIYF